MLKALRDPLLSLIYPQECRVCSRSVESRDDGVACSECWAATRIFTGIEMLCERCGAFLGEKAGPAAVYCRRCDGQFYEKAVAIGVYENALAATIQALKSSPLIAPRQRS